MTASVQAGSGCVLVVDDEADMRATLRDVVEMEGCSVVVAANGAEGLAVLATLRPCLVILDLLMPVMDGRAMLEAMRRDPELAGVPVVISTSAPERAPAGVPVMKKPLDLDAVFGLLRRSCQCAALP